MIPAQLDPAILNVGVDLAMAFGANWMQPVQARLAAKYPHLSAEALDAYDAACREAMFSVQQRVPEHWNAAGADEAEAFRRFKAQVLTSYPWISGMNLEHLWTQGRYYAWKDGLLE